MQDYVKVLFDIDADFSNLFNWNTKQVFLSLAAEYDSKAHVRPGGCMQYGTKLTSSGHDVLQAKNQVVVWDRIIRQRSDAHVKLQEAVNKYGFREVSKSFE